MTTDIIEAKRQEWISKYKVRKLLGFFATVRLQQDWKASLLIDFPWEHFLQKMREYFKSTENFIIRNYEFRQLSQMPNETFCAFCNRVKAADKTCHFCECTKGCRAEQFSIRDQIVIRTTNNTVREKAMLKDWNLIDLRTNGMKYQKAAAGEEKISGVHINKLGAYSYRKLTDKSSQPRKPISTGKTCYRFRMRFRVGHIKQCRVINAKCSNCKKIKHLAKACHQRGVNDIETNVSDTTGEETETYQLSIWNVGTTQNSPKFSTKTIL